jgi:hypothetical protein
VLIDREQQSAKYARPAPAPAAVHGAGV